MTQESELSIGEVAARAGINSSAVRYYERVGLLRQPRRRSGRRLYDDTVFESLALIDLAQDAGLTIAEIRLLLHGFAQAPPSQRWRALATSKLDEITARIERAERMRTVLHGLLRCECETLGHCARSRERAMRTAREGL